MEQQIEAMTSEVIQAVRGFVARSMDAFGKRIESFGERLQALETRAPEKGDNGKDADPELIRLMVAEAVSKIPQPRDGKDADADAVTKDVLGLVLKALEAIPLPKGERGERGIAGPKGDPGDRGEPGTAGESASIGIGDGPPLSAGKIGSVYIDASNGDIYQCA